MMSSCTTSQNPWMCLFPKQYSGALTGLSSAHIFAKTKLNINYPRGLRASSGHSSSGTRVAAELCDASVINILVQYKHFVPVSKTKTNFRDLFYRLAMCPTLFNA